MVHAADYNYAAFKFTSAMKTIVMLAAIYDHIANFVHFLYNKNYYYINACIYYNIIII